MNLAYCFIGKLPEYSVDTIHQARLFFDGPIYFIVNDLESHLIAILKEKYNVNIVPYEECKSTIFNNVLDDNFNRFCIVHNLTGREKLFIYAFERFFCLYNLMNNYTLTNVFFLELDNLIYDDPRNWLPAFNKKDIAYVYDGIERCSSGIAFFKNKDALHKLNEHFINFIKSTPHMVEEMRALYEFWDINKELIQILPTHWISANVPSIAYQSIDDYNSIFDAAGLGICIGGMDLFHTEGVLKKGLKNLLSIIDYTKYKYEWRLDDTGRNIPYIYNEDGNIWIKINNLHVHSKLLADCLSKPM
jgi:hypothetical protein